MLVCRGGASQHSQLWPDLVDAFLLDLRRETCVIRVSPAQAERVQRERERKSVFSCGLSHLSLLIADPAVELLALQADEVISGLQDATFGGDGAGRVDVIPGHHPHRDSSALAFPDGIWDLKVSANSGGGNVTAHRSPPLSILAAVNHFFLQWALRTANNANNRVPLLLTSLLANRSFFRT